VSEASDIGGKNQEAFARSSGKVQALEAFFEVVDGTGFLKDAVAQACLFCVNGIVISSCEGAGRARWERWSDCGGFRAADWVEGDPSSEKHVFAHILMGDESGARAGQNGWSGVVE
jgi:hypothetical protein